MYILVLNIYSYIFRHSVKCRCAITQQQQSSKFSYHVQIPERIRECRQNPKDNISTYECIYVHRHTRMAHDDDGPPHTPRHMLDTARVCERMRVYLYLVDGLYRRAELNKHPHCLQVPALARPQQRCHTAICLRALAGDYRTEVNWIR